jgi:hypothetical protein
METIEVVYKETGVPGTYHKYILYTDSSGNVSYAREGGLLMIDCRNNGAI